MKQESIVPLIGVTCHIDTGSEEDIFPGRALNYIDRNYSDVLLEHKILPVMIPVNQDSDYIDQLLDQVDGIVGTGGGKIPEHILNQEQIPTLQETAPERYRFEKEFFTKVLERDLPVFGVCRSTQTINELFGGKLNSKISYDVSDALEHNQTNLGMELTEPYHKIEITSDSHLANILGETTIEVNSWHSQSISEVAENFKVTAKTEDGVIEAIESTENTFVLLTQFHPEILIEGGVEVWSKLFKELKTQALKYKRRKEG